MDKRQRILDFFLNHIKESVNLTQDEVELLYESIDIVELKRKECVLQPGQVSKHMRFVVTGSMRCYYLDLDSQEHTLQIGIEGWWINDLYSYLSGKESQMFVQAIEKTTLVQINSEALERLYVKIPALSTFFRIKIQNAYVSLQERMLEQMSIQVFDRYQKFIKEYRNIEQRIPQYMIASYLGVTPEFLSYLKKKHSM
ncbi:MULTISPECIES: Crp/Fnr family transcriptional regulator [Myroides]|uniref:Cyclic nucleotide-binding domain-containing protein n=1 Tax=Myroides albus TaxID=2562892 RepID=A0A6I3LN86_9FLAO|nr:MULTISPECIES: Crp/Fnr family transcriptional regulator [Myroides]MTG98770.1 cyclic nucleotide-binding domain-containing protein [Myroides albus]MVX36481.1 cyclic nucleotide-binding domain-containing protein [Myroides sp. LoEW2-1]